MDEVLESAEETPGKGQGRRKGQLHTEVVGHLRKMIVGGEFPPGTRLREVVLCERLGVSRTPVREALRTLAAEGLVALLPNRSVVVAPLDAQEVEHLYLVFSTLEALAAELACARITNEEVGEVGKLLSDMVDYHDRFERGPYMEVNKAIHQRIVEIAGNPILLAQWQSLLPRVERARSLANLDRARWSAALFEHTKMFAALAARDGKLLARLTMQHFMNGLPSSTQVNAKDDVDECEVRAGLGAQQ
jgi:DNA-binding GntR family transcriptional regulator